MIACECCPSALLLFSWAVHLLESLLSYLAPVPAAQDSCLKFLHALCPCACFVACKGQLMPCSVRFLHANFNIIIIGMMISADLWGV